MRSPKSGKCSLVKHEAVQEGEWRSKGRKNRRIADSSDDVSYIPPSMMRSFLSTHPALHASNKYAVYKLSVLLLLRRMGNLTFASPRRSRASILAMAMVRPCAQSLTIAFTHPSFLLQHHTHQCYMLAKHQTIIAKMISVCQDHVNINSARGQ